MANKARPTFQKRQKERARQQKQRDKALHRLAVKQQKAQAGPRGESGEDPDIAGIRPGPQPLPASGTLYKRTSRSRGRARGGEMAFVCSAAGGQSRC
jgi:hypothetical protein